MSANRESQEIELTQAIGECVTAWASAEFQISSLFQDNLRCDVRIVDAIWASVLSFQARITMLHNVLAIRLNESTALMNDWNLLYNYIRKMNTKRNEIAHSTIISVENKALELEPYLVITRPRSRFSIQDVKNVTADFKELNGSIIWMSLAIRTPSEQPLAFPIPIPDLVLRLRAEELQKREAQRARQKSFPP